MIRSRFLWLSGPVLTVALALTACSAKYQGPLSDHLDGKRFHNPGQIKNSSVAGYLWLRLTTSQAPWPDRVAVAPAPAPPTRVHGSEARVTWVGHATVLIQVGGLNILTDPVWSERASPISFAGPKRVSAPAISPQALPPIDVLLISHDHYDHLDIATLRWLDTAHKPRVIVPLGNRALVQEAMPASAVTEHDWGEAVKLVGAAGRATIHVEPMLHGSGRTPFDQMQTLWAAFVIEANGLKLYHVGDTGYGDGGNFRAAGLKHGGFDLAILPIGAYEPASFMADSHMRPSQAVQAMLDANARQALAHHFQTFQLGFEALEAPRNEVTQTLVQRGLPPNRFAMLQPGQSLVVLRAGP
jgi:L-ascorbate metabolism protein UlaG (beta-lactamase superfamily)